MKTLLATLIVGTFAVASSAAFAQGAAPPPAPTPKDKGYGAAYQNPAAQKTAEERKSAPHGASSCKNNRNGNAAPIFRGA